MNVSRSWLQRFFKEPLPASEVIAEALTFKAFEIEHVEGDLLEVKVLPDRAAYALSHRGIAVEVGAALGQAVSEDPLRTPLPAWETTPSLALTIDSEKVNRHMGALVTGVKVGPSPAWLKEALLSVGQRSINNIVDATNFVTLNMGQPLHAFDAGKIARDGSVLRIGIRETLEGEAITTLSGETYTLPESTLVICEGTDGRALDIAGIKGGAETAVDESTETLFVSVANFDGATIRRTAQALKLWTDASQRFQNKLSPELVAYGMRDILALITEVAGGTVTGVVDVYPRPLEPQGARVSLGVINRVLGTSYSLEDVTRALSLLPFTYALEGEDIVVTAPFERRDLAIAQDLIEEVGRVLGYDQIQAQALPELPGGPDQRRYQGIERIKDLLVEHGYVEISTPSFARTGDISIANPLDATRPALRASLAPNMEEALTRAIPQAPRVLGPAPSLKLFEIGSIFRAKGEELALVLGYEPLSGKRQASVLADMVSVLGSELSLKAPETLSVTDSVIELSLADVDLAGLGDTYEPRAGELQGFRAYSQYPFALRDVAVWTPEGTEESEVVNIIVKEAGEHLARIDLFDRFEKEGRVSYAFRLVFESRERTLSDEDLAPAMERVWSGLRAHEGFEVR